MAWNGSDEGGRATSMKSPRGGGTGASTKRPYLRGIVAGSIIIVLGSIAVWYFGGRGETRPTAPSASRKTNALATVEPAKASVQPTQVVEKVEKPLPPQRVGELRDGYRMLCDGTLHRVLGVVTNTPGKFSLADKTFTHSADIELGNLLTVEPGDDLLGDSEGMYTGFGKEFAESLADPIVIDDDDTPEQREMKEGVKELREELCRRIKAGEDIEKIMTETRQQLKELALYREELEEQVKSLSSSDLTQKDYEDLVYAANQMLADRGVKKLELPATLKGMIRLQKVQQKALEREEERKRQEEQKKLQEDAK